MNLAARRAKVPLDPKNRRQFIIKSVSAKQRPRNLFQSLCSLAPLCCFSRPVTAAIQAGLRRTPAFMPPGFAYLRAKARRNPAEVLLTALKEANLDNRVTEGLPWLALASRTWIGIGWCKTPSCLTGRTGSDLS